MPRLWKAGDVYAPHDLSGAEARKWRVKHRPTTDAFDALVYQPPYTIQGELLRLRRCNLDAKLS